MSGGEAPPEVTEVTTTWTSSGSYYCSSYKTGDDAYQSRGTGWKGDGTYNARMGYYTADKRYNAGLWIFNDADTIAQTLAGATIKKATLSLTRSSGVGASSGAVVEPYWHNITAATLQNFTGRCDPWHIS